MVKAYILQYKVPRGKRLSVALSALKSTRIRIKVDVLPSAMYVPLHALFGMNPSCPTIEPVSSKNSIWASCVGLTNESKEKIQGGHISVNQECYFREIPIRLPDK